jgi:two-component system sensor histidine kinase VicK
MWSLLLRFLDDLKSSEVPNLFKSIIQGNLATVEKVFYLSNIYQWTMDYNENSLISIEQVGELSEDLYLIYNSSTHKLEYIGAAFQKIWDRPAKNYKDEPSLLLESIHPEDKIYVIDFLSRSYSSEKPGKIEFRILLNEHTKRYILLKVMPLINEAKQKLFVGIVTDITVTKSNILYAEKINARKNSTLEVLAHDLKTPLGMINMMATAIQQYPKIKGDDTISHYVDLIQKLCERNIKLIRDLVNQEFLESAEVDLRKERADIVFGITDVIENYKKSSDVLLKQFKISSTAKKIYLQFDTLKLMQVFNNLISNAIKFTYDNGIIDVDITDKEQNVMIRIRDNGIGIPEEFHDVLFEKFTPARRTGLKGEKPVGLGMSIIKTIVELHGGKIWFESQVDAGSTFYITIPK